MQAADLWSCGIILYAMLYGRYPFDFTEKHYTRKIVRAEYTIPDEPIVSDECKCLLRQLLVANPVKRITMTRLLSHPWVREHLPADAIAWNQQYLEALPLSLHQVHMLHD